MVRELLERKAYKRSKYFIVLIFYLLHLASAQAVFFGGGVCAHACVHEHVHTRSMVNM